MTRVLVGGSINTDLVVRVHRAPERGETVTGQAFAIFGGGKGANQAVAVARSGASTVMLGGLGDDDFGRQRRKDLAADGIDTANIATIGDAASGVALITVEDSGENRIAYVPGATMRVTVAQAEQALRAAAPQVVLTTLELPLETLTWLYGAARAAGAKTVFNATPEPAGGRDLLPLTDVLIVNETEATELLGGPQTDWLDAAAALQRLGPPSVVITLGADGAVARLDGAAFTAKPPKVEVVDTTGAGDSFCGAFTAAISEGLAPEQALRLGVAAGSLAVTVQGAQPSVPKRAAIEALAGQVEITRVA